MEKLSLDSVPVIRKKILENGLVIGCIEDFCVKKERKFTLLFDLQLELLEKFNLFIVDFHLDHIIGDKVVDLEHIEICNNDNINLFKTRIKETWNNAIKIGFIDVNSISLVEEFIRKSEAVNNLDDLLVLFKWGRNINWKVNDI